MAINLITAWFEIICGLLFGAIIGLFFSNENWLGGYNSWQRRMLRLAHISFFGIAFINIAFVFTCNYFNITKDLKFVSILYIIAAITMPLICVISSFIKIIRHLFFIPALSLIIGSIIFIYKGLF